MQEVTSRVREPTQRCDAVHSAMWGRLRDTAGPKGAARCWLLGPTAGMKRARRWWESLSSQQKRSLTNAAEASAELRAASELAVLLRSALAALPEDHQMLLTAKYVHGLSVEDIANRVGLCRATVDAKLGHARRAFQWAFQKLAGEGFET
jgi:DNA-directed RNA polymerase specialized sigma24 family protein